MLRYIITFILVLLSCRVGPATATEHYGRGGDPIALMVAYQPSYAPAWSAVVLRAKEFWQRHLPQGSTVQFTPAGQGTIVIAQMYADLMPIGYLGDMPSLLGTSKPHLVDMRIVAALARSSHLCGQLFVRADAPQFPSPAEALQWLDRRRVTVPAESCADRFLRHALADAAVTPSEYRDVRAAAIRDSFKTGGIDAAAVWEPHASRLVAEGLARQVAIGTDLALQDSAYLVMRADLLRARPDIAKGWLQAELDAQLYLADPRNAAEIVSILQNELGDFSREVLGDALYRGPPVLEGQCRISLDFVLSESHRAMLSQSSRFLHQLALIPAPWLRNGLFEDGLARTIVAERGLSEGPRCIPALPRAAFMK